jgi:pimeloyl-ACP methyl ester carboxylesterase
VLLLGGLKQLSNCGPGVCVSASLGSYVARSVQQVASDVRAEVIVGCGHWIAEEQPQALVSLLLDFLPSKAV